MNVEEEEPEKNKEKKFKRCVHYYLIPTKIFKIDKEEREIKAEEQKERMKKQENLRLKRSYSGKDWIFRDYRHFHLKYNNKILDKYNIGFPYVNC